MVNTEDFIERLERLLQYYGMSASGFADKINVQRSSISHLLSGRNKPSLDFVMKVVRTFPEVNLYWLLNGKGSFPDDTPPISEKKAGAVDEDKEISSQKKSIERIVVFYSDGSFDAYGN
ncbi:MAG: helix-turn-helix domain-containing protein [Aurantibacter sp.]